MAVASCDSRSDVHAEVAICTLFQALSEQPPRIALRVAIMASDWMGTVAILRLLIMEYTALSDVRDLDAPLS
jgi:hypothetical protein